jgi:hypothetical protein
VRFCRQFASPLSLRRQLVLCSGFDYHLNAIQNEDNELLKAYKDMFEHAISQPGGLKSAIYAYAPILKSLFVRLVLWPFTRC